MNNVTEIFAKTIFNQCVSILFEGKIYYFERKDIHLSEKDNEGVIHVVINEAICDGDSLEVVSNKCGDLSTTALLLLRNTNAAFSNSNKRMVPKYHYELSFDIDYTKLIKIYNDVFNPSVSIRRIE